MLGHDHSTNEGFDQRNVRLFMKMPEYFSSRQSNKTDTNVPRLAIISHCRVRLGWPGLANHLGSCHRLARDEMRLNSSHHYILAGPPLQFVGENPSLPAIPPLRGHTSLLNIDHVYRVLDPSLPPVQIHGTDPGRQHGAGWPGPEP